MWCSAIGCIVTLILSLLTVPPAADAQPPAKIPRVRLVIGRHRRRREVAPARGIPAWAPRPRLCGGGEPHHGAPRCRGTSPRQNILYTSAEINRPYSARCSSTPSERVQTAIIARLEKGIEPDA